MLLASVNTFQFQLIKSWSSSDDHCRRHPSQRVLGSLFPAQNRAASAAVWHTEPTQQLNTIFKGPKHTEVQPIPPFLADAHRSTASRSFPQVMWLVHRKPALSRGKLLTLLKPAFHRRVHRLYRSDPPVAHFSDRQQSSHNTVLCALAVLGQ